MSRQIIDILNFRQDISPFLVHLTRRSESFSASEILRKIIAEKVLRAGDNPVSDARFGINTIDWTPEKKKKYFGAVCFTETPLNEIHCLLEIEYRNINLEPYGLVFLKGNLQKLGVSPAFYLNNFLNDKNEVIQKICISLIESEEAAKFLPLFANFGIKLTAPNAKAQNEEINFMWEREWRFPSIYNDLPINPSDIFVGLCPDSEIDYFENLTFEIFSQKIGFVDPQRNMKWYATKLIEKRKSLDMSQSVV